MKNVTVSMEDELHRATRMEAAKAGKSVSRYIADVLRLVQQGGQSLEERKRRLEALERVFNGPKYPLSENGRMPSADERNARR